MNKDQFYTIVKPHTITSRERIDALWDSLEYIRSNNIPGDLVECGVMAGGNILGMMEYCQAFGMKRNIWAYDTFDGMTEPEAVDRDYTGCHASTQNVACRVSLKEVINSLSVSEYPSENVNFVVGDVCQTLLNEKNVPSQIALLRLDTDWHASTKCELEILYPLLVQGGVLIIDDYGHWQGARKAVDDYFGNVSAFTKIDYTGIKLTK